MKKFSIRTYGLVLLSAGVILGLLFIGGALTTKELAGRSATAWSTYQDDRSERALALAPLVSVLGYGGLIHEFKNYVLRQDEARHHRLIGLVGQTAASFRRYRLISDLAEEEIIALNTVEATIQVYVENIAQVELMIEAGATPEEIDAVVRINDHPALAALDVLERRHAADDASSPYGHLLETKASLLSELHELLGYGGMIHRFKNLILRFDEAQLARVEHTTSGLTEVIALYRDLGTDAHEEEALEAISVVVESYVAQLPTIREMAVDGATAAEIDAAVFVLDYPALDGLEYLAAAISRSNSDQAHALSGNMEVVGNVANFILFATLIAVFAAIMAGYYLIYCIILNPISAVTKTMNRLAEGDTDVDIEGSPGGREIDDMKRAIQVFHDDQLRLRDAKVQLKESEELSALFDAVSDVVIMSDVSGKIVAVNETAGRIFGYSSEELIGEKLEILMPPHVAAQHDRYLSRNPRFRSSMVIGQRRSLIAVRKNGSEFPIDLSVNAFEVDGKRMVVGVLRDITLQMEQEEILKSAREELEVSNVELRTANERIREEANRYIELSVEAGKLRVQAEKSAALFRLVAENAPYAIGITAKADSTILFVNDQNRKIFGLEIGDKVKPFGNQFRDDKNDYRLTPMERFKRDGQIIDEEISLHTEKVGQFWALLSIIPVQYDGKECFLYCLNDISERKAYEQDLLAMKGNLESQTEELQALALRLDETRKEAVEASVTKSAFLANMSHELRTPMNGILGIAELTLMSDLPDSVGENIEIIQESGEALLDLLNGILDLSKVEAGKLDLETVDVDLFAVIKSASVLIGDQVKKDGLSYRESFDDGLISRGIKADPTRLRQVLTNLLSNAKKFTHEGSIELFVSQRLIDDDKLETRFEVSDTGIGMSQEQVDNVFNAFHQADEATTRKYGGTGLGLSICEQLVGLMGGEIGVWSHEGSGSTFWFTITGGIADLKSLTKTVPEKKVARISLDEFGSNLPNILVAEDNEVNQRIIGKMLDAIGCGFKVVSNGQEAIDALETDEFDLVMMDVNMPVLDGVDATQIIRSGSGRNAQLPIVALTANAMKGDREKYIEVGMNDYVPKPISPAKLCEVIAKHAASDKGEDQAAAISSEAS